VNFKLYNCDVGFMRGGVRYDFGHVDSVTGEDPQSKKLVRGANAANKVGLLYREGVKDPHRATFTLIDLPLDIKTILDAVYENEERCDWYVIDRKTGSSKTYKDAILSNQPQQLNIDETPESLNVALVIESFNLVEVHKE